MPGSDVVLETQDLGYAYTPGRYAVRHLSLNARRGEVLGLLGRNGAGKTTTVRILTTLLPPTEGRAEVLGVDVRTGGRALRGRLGVVLQQESLDFVSVERNLTLYAFMWGVEREKAKTRAEEMIELFELDHCRRRKPWALSGGERRRFQVARELMHDMELLFLDEPTVGLDAVARRRILRYLRQRAQGGLTILFTTHLLHEADMLCDRVAVMHEGSLKALDTPEGLKRQFGGAREVAVAFRGRLPPEAQQELTSRAKAVGAEVLGFEPSGPAGEDEARFRSERAEELVSELAQWANQRSLPLARLSVEETTLEGAFLGLVGADEEGAEETEETEATSGPRPGAPPSSTAAGGMGAARGLR